MAAHSYWRVLINSLASGTDVAVVECEMRAIIGGADQCTGGTILADNADVGNRFRIFDGVIDWSFSCTFENGDYWGYQFAEPVDISEVRIVLGTEYGAAMPGSLSFDYSDDGLAWTTQKTVTPITWSPDGFSLVDNLFDFSADGYSCELPSLNLPISVNAGSIQIPEYFNVELLLLNLPITANAGSIQIPEYFNVELPSLNLPISANAGSLIRTIKASFSYSIAHTQESLTGFVYQIGMPNYTESINAFEYKASMVSQETLLVVDVRTPDLPKNGVYFS